MLLRRLQQRAGHPLQVIGTSATIATGEDRDARRAAIADVAGRLFGADVPPSNVIDEVKRLVFYAADDAALERSPEVTPDVLRYTYLIFLLRQGIRAGDVGRIVGHVPHNDLVANMQRHSPEARLPFEQVERVLPALRELAESGKPLTPPAIDQI